ncbi:hypothetical protein [Sphingomonas pruni]|uniref:hypothetical protein n=1 Tax=Sphingomonas pruni TaxID=40683 RepID=UPI00082B5E9C|nr:hypothetical protein [Sphingomonas pruni]
MKRVLLLGAILAALSGCGGSQTAVGQNSADSITTTAVGNVVATVPSPTPTPVENAAAAADNVGAPDDSAATNDTSANASASSDAHQE